MIKNKRKQEKIIGKLNKLRIEYHKFSGVTFQNEKQKFFNSMDSEVLHESEDAESFYDRKYETLNKIQFEYNRLNEKLPHHIRLEIL